MFEISINPFTQEIEISKNNEGVYIYQYKELDEWFSFIHQDKMYDVHFCYEYKPMLSIYFAHTTQSVKCKIKVATK